MKLCIIGQLESRSKFHAANIIFYIILFHTYYISIHSIYNDITFFIVHISITFPYIQITMISNTISLVNCMRDLYTVSVIVLAKLINSQECMYVSPINHSPSHQIVSHSRRATSVRLWFQVME